MWGPFEIFQHFFFVLLKHLGLRCLSVLRPNGFAMRLLSGLGAHRAVATPGSVANGAHAISPRCSLCGPLLEEVRTKQGSLTLAQLIYESC